jgi:hypothetical protein
MTMRRLVLAILLTLPIGAGAALAQDKPKPPTDILKTPQARENLCLTCPRPEPVCWLMVYRWEDYNLKAGLGTTVLVNEGEIPTPQQKEKARQEVLRALGRDKEYTVTVKRVDRITCPKGARVGG